MNQTELLALWGAITGTVGTCTGLFGLWLRFRQHNLDKAKLICESSFGFDSPDYPKNKLILRSIGRRPVSIDKIRYFITPKNWKHKITKFWQHKQGHWLYHREPTQKIKLNEGEKTEINISLCNGLNIADIYKVEIIDQTGKAWPVKWLPHLKLQKITSREILDEFIEENQKRIVTVTGYRLGEKYFLQVNFNTKPQRMNVTSGKGFWFSDLKKYQEKMQDIKDAQLNKFLSGEIEEIQ